MMGEIERGRRVGLRGELQFQGAAVQGEFGTDSQRARIAFLAGRRVVVQLQAVLGLRLHRPHPAPESARAAMQMIGALVGGDRVALSVQVEGRAGDAVAEAADQHAEISRIVQIGVQRRQAEHQLGTAARGVQAEAAQQAAVGQQLRAQACAAVQHHALDSGTVGKLAEDR